MSVGRLVQPFAAAAAITAVAVSVLTAAVPAAAAPSRAATPGWRIVSTVAGGDLAVTSPGGASAWAFGVSGGFGQPEHPLARHWNGRQWSAVGVPGALKGGIGCAGASSPRNVWAFSGTSLDAGDATPAALRLVGTRWVVAHRFPAGYLTGCAVLSATNIWVFGTSHVGRGIGTWHFNGKTWQRVATSGFSITAASALSANNIWAEAEDADGNNTVIAHWNGHAWQRNAAYNVALPRAGGGTQVFTGPVTPVAPGNVWAASTVVRSNPRSTTAVVQHWNGTKWQRVGPANSGFYLPGSVRDGHGGRWSPGYAPSSAKPYLIHESGGRWVRVRLPIPAGSSLDLTDLVNIPGTRTMLAAGLLETKGGGRQGVVLAYGALPR